MAAPDGRGRYRAKPVYGFLQMIAGLGAAAGREGHAFANDLAGGDVGARGRAVEPRSSRRPKARAP